MHVNHQSKMGIVGLLSVLAGIMLIIMFSVPTPVAPVQAHIEPELAAVAKDSPQTAVRIMIHQTVDAEGVETAVQQLGGTILHDLYLLNSLAVELPAGAVHALANNPHIEAMQLDQMLTESVDMLNDTLPTTPEIEETPTLTVRDNFEQSAFDNNDGTADWQSPWEEINDNGRPQNGLVMIRNGQLYLRGSLTAIRREVDLTEATTAVLSFDYLRQRFDDDHDLVSVGVSTDGGSNWTLLGELGGPVNDSEPQTAVFDLSSFTGQPIQIGLLTSSQLRRNERLIIDNLQIEYTNPPRELPTGIHTLRDEFDQVSFANSDGSLPWATPWDSFDFGGESPESGYVFIQDGRLTFHYAYTREENATRRADLYGAQQATLSFEWETDSLDGAETISVLISADGQTFTELAAYGGTQSGSAEFDISPYISANTTIRLENRSEHWEADDYAFFDNIEITVAYAETAVGRSLEETVPSTPTQPDDNITPEENDNSFPKNNHYLQTIHTRPVWNQGLTGEAVTVAVIDSGISPHADFGDRLLAQVSFNANAQTVNDTNGHGTHVAGIVGGNGFSSNRKYVGVAPQVNLVSLKVLDESGRAYESDTVAAMQWVLENKDLYNIRIVNLSINSNLEQTYHESALNLAAEILWFNNIVVVASAGNRSKDGLFYTITASPANDPYIITVGSSDEKDTDDRLDDTISLYSAHGKTLSGHIKPDIIAPGYNIISTLSPHSSWLTEHPDRVEGNGAYFRMSGTSMAAPIVSGAVALLLQSEPHLTPDQVKYRLMHTGSNIDPLWYDSLLDSHTYAYVNVQQAVNTPTTELANEGLMPHSTLAKMAMIAYWASTSDSEEIDWESVDWESVNWDAVEWESVNWASVNWASVNWASVNWASVNWASVNWASVNWASVNWASVNWASVNWASVNWGSMNTGSGMWDE